MNILGLIKKTKIGLENLGGLVENKMSLMGLIAKFTSFRPIKKIWPKNNKIKIIEFSYKNFKF